VATASSSPAIASEPAAAAPSLPDFAKIVVAPLRTDLITSEQIYLGRAYVIIKNPISLTYFRLSRAHFDAASRYDGQTPLGSIAAALQQTSVYWRALPLEQALEELIQLANQLLGSGVLQGSGHQALKRINATHARRQHFRLESVIGSVLYIKKSLIDPNRLLGRLDPFFSWMYTREYVIAFFVGGLVTLFMLAGHWQELAVHGANFFTLQNLALTWVVFIFVKTIHEFGHGLTCKHFGGEVHEMGALLIMLTPFLYCNVSDSWLLPDKRRRILVTAAGIFIEMTLAMAAAWVWVGTSPGLVHQISFNIMFTCSVTTLLFNANPLMKYDGYYMLSDALEVPNLKQKSNAAATVWAQRYVLGLHRGGPAQFFSYELSPLFALYAIASYFYGWLVLYRISGRMFDLLTPYGLDFLSHSYVWLYLFTALALPCFRLMKVTYQNPSTRAAAGRRCAQIGLGLAALLVVAWFIPWEATIKRGVVIDNAVVETVAARTPGFLREVYVHDGDIVHAGQPLARLENLDLQTDIDEFTREADAYEVQRRGALSDPTDSVRQSAAAYAKLAQEATLQAQLRQSQLGECTLCADHGGVVREQHLDNLVGQYFPRGRKFCEVGSAGEFRAIISLDEGQARRVMAGQSARLCLRALSGEIFSGTITSAPVSDLARLTNNASANLTGGDVPTQVNKDGMLEPTVVYYEAEMLVRDTGQERLRSGLTGMARIDVGKTTLGRQLCSSILDLINPAIRL
jgi:putative peptide zinc metalloprotease protein